MLHLFEFLKDETFRRAFSFTTSFVLSLSVILSVFGTIGDIVLQSIASIAIVIGTVFELFLVMINIQITNREDKVGWILHRFSYVTLFVMIASFLSIVGSTFLSSFFIFGRDVMVIAVIWYSVQASFGICYSSISYHFLSIKQVWRL